MEIFHVGSLAILRFALISSCLLAQVASPATVSNPAVIGPIPAMVPPRNTSHDYPFFATPVDLARYGYIEEEFFLDGAANRYSTPPLTTGSIIDGGHWYRTRMLVRRPTSASNFNGTVLMEWLNVTAGYDLDAVWLQLHDHLIRRGYAWVGVSVQQLGIHHPATGLRAWSPNRYGTLDVTEGGAILDDSLSYDIFSQAAQAVRSPVGVDPMGGLQVNQIVATGASQSAYRLAVYHNSIHPLTEIFDAYSLGVGGGLLRTDLEVKVFKVLTETDLVMLNQAAMRQPDSDHYRRWEVAGAAHFDFYIAQQTAPLRYRDGMPPAMTDCTLTPFSRIPLRNVMSAATDHLVRWVTDDVAPPHAPDIELAAFGPPVVVARDSFGNALGGIRLSQHSVPTATNTGINSGPEFCYIYGSFEPFPGAQLSALYPNHGSYVGQVARATDENLERGFLVIEDATATVQEAAQSDIGKQ